MSWSCHDRARQLIQKPNPADRSESYSRVYPRERKQSNSKNLARENLSDHHWVAKAASRSLRRMVTDVVWDGALLRFSVLLLYFSLCTSCSSQVDLSASVVECALLRRLVTCLSQPVPWYHLLVEVCLVVWIVRLLFFAKKYKLPTEDTLTKEESADRLSCKMWSSLSSS